MRLFPPGVFGDKFLVKETTVNSPYSPTALIFIKRLLLICLISYFQRLLLMRLFSFGLNSLTALTFYLDRLQW
jgi:hypothetical protein